jgi:hypothetical protein
MEFPAARVGGATGCQRQAIRGRYWDLPEGDANWLLVGGTDAIELYRQGPLVISRDGTFSGVA